MERGRKGDKKRRAEGFEKDIIRSFVCTVSNILNLETRPQRDVDLQPELLRTFLLCDQQYIIEEEEMTILLHSFLNTPNLNISLPSFQEEHMLSQRGKIEREQEQKLDEGEKGIERRGVTHLINFRPCLMRSYAKEENIEMHETG
jgi:hypothetical protein